MPTAPTMRPMVTSFDGSPWNGPATAGRSAALLGRRFLGLAGDVGLATLDELLHGIRRLRTLADPMGDAVERNAVLGLVLGCLGIVETDALDEAPVTGHAGI